MLDLIWAQKFAEEWIESWNSHDLDRILSHYTDDFEMISPNIIRRVNEPSGRLKGKDKVRPYWQAGLSALPPLRFELIDVFAGVDSIAIYYRSAGRRMATEVFFINEDRQVIKGVAHYGRPA